MALQHLSGDLGVPWFVGPDKTDDRKASKKQEPAKRNQRQQLGGAARAIVRSD